jgi:hypothetical protein
MNKLSLVGMQLPEKYKLRGKQNALGTRLKYKENFDVSSEGPSSGVISGITIVTPIEILLIFFR